MNAVEQVKQWVETVVVEYNFCPFAKYSIDHSAVRYVSIEQSKKKAVLQLLADECLLLEDDKTIDTTLIVLEVGYEDFYDYLDLLDECEQILEMSGLNDSYQLASFHPDYCFDGESQGDPANYTNRAPWPVLHLLREEAVAKALEGYDQPEMIPEANIQLCRNKGLDYMAALLRASKE